MDAKASTSTLGFENVSRWNIHYLHATLTTFLNEKVGQIKKV